MAKSKGDAAFFEVTLSRPVQIGKLRIAPSAGLRLSAKALADLKADKDQADAILKAEPIE